MIAGRRTGGAPGAVLLASLLASSLASSLAPSRAYGQLALPPPPPEAAAPAETAAAETAARLGRVLARHAADERGRRTANAALALGLGAGFAAAGVAGVAYGDSWLD